MSITIIMKKRFKIIIPICSVLFITIFIVILSITRSNQDKFYVVKKHYSSICNEYPKLELLVFCNSKDTDYLKKEKISKTSIYNKEDYYATEISIIKLLDETKEIKEEKFYQYKIELKFNFEIEKMFNISDAKLELTYFSNEKMIINVGNICFEKINDTNILDVDKVQAVCNDLGNLESLVSVKISLKNNMNNDVIIKSIKTISSSIKVNNEFVYIDEYNSSIDHTTPLSQLYGTNFNIYCQSAVSLKHIDFDQNTAKDIIIPLTYTQKEFVDHIGFIIEIEYNGETYYQIINPYILFSTSNLEFVLYEYEIINDQTV